MLPEIDYLQQLQWPAMVVTVIAAWLIASQSRRKRLIGFGLFLVSNILWVVWGWHVRAYALIALQIALAALNFRGIWKNETASNAPPASSSGGSPSLTAERGEPAT